MISRGAQGWSPLVKISVHFGGLRPPKTLALALLFRVYWPCFQSAMINCGLLFVIEASLIVDYTISVLK